MRLEMTSICSCSFDIHNNYCHYYYYYCTDLFLIRLIFLGYVVLQLVRLLYWQAMQCGDMWGWETEINRRQRTNDSVYYPIRRQRKSPTDSSILIIDLCIRTLHLSILCWSTAACCSGYSAEEHTQLIMARDECTSLAGLLIHTCPCLPACLPSGPFHSIAPSLAG